MKGDDPVAFLEAAYPGEPWPKPFHVLEGCLRLRRGETLEAAAAAVKTLPGRLEEIATHPDPAFAVLGVKPTDLAEADVRRARRVLGQLLIGRAAEIVFEDLYREQMGQETEFRLIDLREGRTDTDYRLLNGQDRPIYRINIKFTGSLFRRAAEMVDLAPEDCFPLATYKIYGALQKQEAEHLPYIFVIVGVPDLTAASIEDWLPEGNVEMVALISKSKRLSRKRDLEDRLVQRIVAAKSKPFLATYDRIRSAEWYVLSARKADGLLRQLLFERVFALKIRGFAQQFRRAELDMHFSLRNDLTTLREFLRLLREEGQTKMASRLERGTI
jgi:hypothetical protein